MEKVIICAAVTGSITSRSETPYLPLTTEEIANAVIEVEQAGAAMAHVHARDENGIPTQNLEDFRRIVDRIREKGSKIILNLSTGSAGNRASLAQRSSPVRLSPEMASLDCGSMNFADWVFQNPPDFLEHLAREMLEYQVKPEIECFDVSMIHNALGLVEKGLVRQPPHFQLVLGVRGGTPATVKNLLHMVEQLPPNATWSVCAIGRHQLAMNMAGLIMGGHIRTGLEDNVYYAKGELAKSNGQLVERLVLLANEFGRPVAGPDEARSLLHLPSRQA